MDLYEIKWQGAIYQNQGLNDAIAIVGRILTYSGWSNVDITATFMVVDIAAQCSTFEIKFGIHVLSIKRTDD